MVYAPWKVKKKNKKNYLRILSPSLPCLTFQIFSSCYRGVKVERESWDNPLITSEALNISCGEGERERGDVGGWELVLLCICLQKSIIKNIVSSFSCPLSFSWVPYQATDCACKILASARNISLLVSLSNTKK